MKSLTTAIVQRKRAVGLLHTLPISVRANKPRHLMTIHIRDVGVWRLGCRWEDDIKMDLIKMDVRL